MGTVLCHKTAAWPDRCIKCNAPAEGFRLKRKLYWHAPWIYLTILVGPLIYVIIALVTRKGATIHMGLCPTHRKRRRNGILLGWLGTLAMVGTCNVGTMQSSGAIIGLSILGLLVSLVASTILTQTVKVKKIDDRYAWVKCGNAFVSSLPPVQG